MLAAITLDHRLAFLLLCALVVGAAVPLTMAWARVLPEDAPPLARNEDSRDGAKEELPGEEEKSGNRDPFAIVLLVCVTLSYALRFPGFPSGAVLHWLSTRLPEACWDWGLLSGRAFFVVVPGLATCHSVVQPNFLRIPLIAAGILVLLLWLLQPILFAAMTAP
ncbi:MAG: hypothetical protein ACHQLQ_00685 [Candidatus Acidiferrales bacterium]